MNIKTSNRRSEANASATNGAVVLCAAFVLGLLQVASAQAQEHLGNSAQDPAAGDCTTIDLSYESHSGVLTDQEISELRDAQHRASLNQFERCTAQKIGRSGGGGAGGGQGGSGSGGSANASVASAGVAGTQAPSLPESPESNEEVLDAEAPPPTEVIASQANGRAPQDIPPADSDGALAAQIRRAAESETDPARSAKLWNEYRKIKGLPTR